MADFKISIIDLQQRYHEEREELLACVERVLKSGHFVLTPELTVTNLFRCLERLDCPYRRHTGLCRRS